MKSPLSIDSEARTVTAVSQFLAWLLALVALLTFGWGLIFSVLLFPVVLVGMVTGAALHGIGAYNASGGLPAVSRVWVIALSWTAIVAIVVWLTFELVQLLQALPPHWQLLRWIIAVNIAYTTFHILLFAIFSVFLTGRVMFREQWWKYVGLSVALNPYNSMVALFGVAALIGLPFVVLPLGIGLVVVVTIWMPGIYEGWFRKIAKDLADNATVPNPYAPPKHKT